MMNKRNPHLFHPHPTPTTSRRLRLLVVGFLVVATVAWAQSSQLLVPVRSGECRETFTYWGELEARESVSITAPELRDARLMTVRAVLDDGTPVKQGDIVIEMEDDNFQVALETARNELELAAAELEKSRFDLQNEGIDLDLNIQREQIDLEKAKTAVVEGAVTISKIDLQKARLAVELAQLNLDQAKKTRAEFEKKRQATLKVHELQVAEAQRKIRIHESNISKAKVPAPADGIVYRPFVRLNNDMGRIDAGKVVRPGDKLLELPNPMGFHGVIYLPAPDYGFINPGDVATLTLTIAPEHALPARVVTKELYPISRNERLGRNDPEGYLKEYKVLLSVVASATVLRSGLTFQADIQPVIASACLFIPRAAVIVEGDPPQSFVWISTATGPQRRPITLGRNGVTFVEVTSGLTPGDSVALDVPAATQASDTAAP